MRTIPSSKVLDTGKPLWWKTSTIKTLSASVSAWNSVIPCRRAAAASSSTSRVPSPWDWNASSTTKAISAVEVPGRRS